MGPFGESAKIYRDLGFNVLPVKKYQKKPCIPWEHLINNKQNDDDFTTLLQKYETENIGIVTGLVSKIAVVDIDGPEGFVVEEKLPPTLIVSTDRGKHYYFKIDKPLRSSIALYPKVDIKADGSYVLAPPSIHPNGTKYQLTVKNKLAELPEWIRTDAESTERIRSKEGIDKIILLGVDEGERNVATARYSGFLINKGYGESECLRILTAWNKKNRPPLPEKELFNCYYSILRSRESQEFTVSRGKYIEEAKEVVSKWLYFEDDSVIDLLLSVASTYAMESDPVWLMIVAPPGSGKTELLRSMRGFGNTYYLDKITPATMISGARDGEGILQQQPKENSKMLLIGKDFGDILAQGTTMSGPSILQQFRSLYDGEYSARFGSAKGTFEWKGKINFVCGVTQEIESTQSQRLLGPLGERFLYYKMIPKSKETIDNMAIMSSKVTGKESLMRREIAAAMLGVLKECSKRDPSLVRVPDEIMNWTMELCKLMVRLRVVVKRKTGTMGQWEIIDYKPSPESPTRMLKALKILMMGIAFVNGRDEVTQQDYAITCKVALDGMESFRRDVLKTLYDQGANEWLTVRDVAEKTNIPVYTATIALENLSIVGVIERIQQSNLETVSWTSKLPKSKGNFVYRIIPDTIKCIEACGIKDSL